MNKRIIILSFVALFLFTGCATLKKQATAPIDIAAVAADTGASVYIKLKSGDKELAKVLYNLGEVYGTPRFKVDVSLELDGSYVIMEKLYYQQEDTDIVVVVSTTNGVVTSIVTADSNSFTLPLKPEPEIKQKTE